jgi:hypothetical protein
MSNLPLIEKSEEAECRDRQISENDPKKGYLCAPALLSAQCLPMLYIRKGPPLPSPQQQNPALPEHRYGD